MTNLKRSRHRQPSFAFDHAAWISPDGEIIPVTGSHEKIAATIVDDPPSVAFDALLADGWIRVADETNVFEVGRVASAKDALIFSMSKLPSNAPVVVESRWEKKKEWRGTAGEWLETFA